MPAPICPITGTPPEKTLIVFDKDGVLLDLSATWLPMIIAMGGYLEEKCNGATSKEDLLAAVGVDVDPGHPQGGVIRENSHFASGTFAQMREIWSEHEPKLIPIFEDVEAYREDMNNIVMSVARGATVSKGAVQNVIATLKKAGFRLGVATNDNTESTTATLKDMHIDDQFDVIVCSDSGHGRKPEGGGLLHAADVTGIPPDAAIMVGDTATDYLAADAAGYKGFITVADSAPSVPDFIPRTDAVILSIDDLPGIVLG